MSFEKKFFIQETPFWLVASDEAGRGPLAGPVVAGAVALKVECPVKAVKRLAQLRRMGITDSKAINTNRRQSILSKLSWTHGIDAEKEQEIGGDLVATWSQCTSEEIDTINILQASLKAMHQAALIVSKKENLPIVWLIDGNKAPAFVSETWQTHTVVSGDAKSVLIGLASVIAKETRDRFMQDYDNLYPGYGLAQHAGHGTKLHREAIAKLGPTPLHRKTFSGVKEYL